MNLILLNTDDFVNTQEAVLKGRRCQHITEILKASEGQVLRVGLINGKIGEAHVLEVSPKQVRLEVQLSDHPPAKNNAVVILALPRPPVFKRIVASAAAIGIEKLVVLQTRRVEKSYWQSPALDSKVIHEQILLGLEQAGDTILPEICLRKRFKAFVEDELAELTKGRMSFVAHPEGPAACPCNIRKPFVLAVGPEGGFIPHEIEMFKAKGFQCVSLGDRPLRVEPAFHMLLGRMIRA